VNLQAHDNQDSKKVWLSQTEVDQLLEHADDTEHYVCFALGVRCGLRSHEMLDVAPQHVYDTDAGYMLRVHHGKGSKFRETPLPSELARQITTIGDIRNEPADEPVISTDSTRTLRGWINRHRKQLASATDDPGWLELSLHDLRRTWATALSDEGVDPLIALSWGGWEDLETFRSHYKGPYSPKAKRENREKVAWL
jgi:integrase